MFFDSKVVKIVFREKVVKDKAMKTRKHKERSYGKTHFSGRDGRASADR